jgi:hypothetical protein
MLRRLPQKKDVAAFFAHHADAIQAGTVVILCVDQCHLIWDDARGYAWG